MEASSSALKRACDMFVYINATGIAGTNFVAIDVATARSDAT
jgi:hypothetical protein